MNSSLILSLVTFVYGLAAVLYIAGWIFNKQRLYKPAIWAVWLGISGNLAGFGLSVMYLIKKEPASPLLAPLPAHWIMDGLTHQMVMFGFLFLSVGIITGAVWANSAWGRYWGWDPKETWSLITWFVYATLLHVRFMRGWQGKRLAVFSIVGFASVLFTYFGVNLLPGLHSYGAN